MSELNNSVPGNVAAEQRIEELEAELNQAYQENGALSERIRNRDQRIAELETWHMQDCKFASEQERAYDALMDLYDEAAGKYLQTLAKLNDREAALDGRDTQIAECEAAREQLQAERDEALAALAGIIEINQIPDAVDAANIAIAMAREALSALKAAKQ